MGKVKEFYMDIEESLRKELGREPEESEIQKEAQTFLEGLNEFYNRLEKDSEPVQDGYTYLGHTYSHWLDIEPEENCKIFHEVEVDGKKIDLDWSPYSTPTVAEFNLWVDLGCPGRVGCGPLRSKDLIEIAKQKKHLPFHLELKRA